MTFFTPFLAEKKYVAIRILFGVCLIATASASGQTGVDLKPLIGISIEAADQDKSAASREETKDIGIPAVSASLSEMVGRHRETNPKPHAPVSIAAIDRERPDLTTAPPVVASSRFFTTEEQPKIGPVADPTWRPSQAPRFGISDDDDDDVAQNGASYKFHWRRAILQSLVVQGFQHAYAITVQERTRRQLKGKFFKDYIDSVKGLHGWDDGNRFFTNYIAHPMQGAMTGFIFVQNHDRVKKQKFAESKIYWTDRLKAMLWSAAWSMQWEIGPMSQASIGNVGKEKGMGYVDLVITPTVGTGWMMVEEAIDRYVIRHLEKKSTHIRVLLRIILNPVRSVANLARLKEPWYRDRPVGH